MEAEVASKVRNIKYKVNKHMVKITVCYFDWIFFYSIAKSKKGTEQAFIFSVWRIAANCNIIAIEVATKNKWVML